MFLLFLFILSFTWRFMHGSFCMSDFKKYHIMCLCNLKHRREITCKNTLHRVLWVKKYQKPAFFAIIFHFWF